MLTHWRMVGWMDRNSNSYFASCYKQVRQKLVKNIAQAWLTIGPVNTIKVMSSWSGQRSPGQALSSKPLPSNCAHSFAGIWQLLFFNQRKWENDWRKCFMINLHQRMLPDPAGIKPKTSSVGCPADRATKACWDSDYERYYAAFE